MNFLRNNIFSRFIRNIASGVREIAEGVAKLTGRRISTKNKVTGLKDANKNNVDKSKVKNAGYINTVDNFAPKPEESNIKPLYNYTKKEGDVNIGSGYAGLGETVTENEGWTDNGDTGSGTVKDMWDNETLSGEDEEFYHNKLAELSKGNTKSRKEILNFYQGVERRKDSDEWVKETDNIIKQVHKHIPFNDISHVPHLLANYKDITEQLKGKVVYTLTPDFKDEIVEQEVSRYVSVGKDFLDVTEKDGKFYFNDWRFGIKTVDFLLKETRFPEIMLLLTPKPIDEVVQVIRSGYFPSYYQGTPYEKIVKIFEKFAHSMVNDTGNTVYTFPKAYHAYKQRLPMYDRLRNNGRLADVNTVLGYFYNGIDKIEVSDEVIGDAYLGLIEPEEFINAYLQFFYGKAKQTQAMSDFSLKMMKKNPEVMKRINERGLALADNPENAIVSVSRHIVILINVGGEKYNIVMNKAPSDIKSEDITNIAGMFEKGNKKTKARK